MNLKDKPLNIIILLATFAADIDIFLLMEEDQKTDRVKSYTTQEIRDQLTASMAKFAKVLPQNGYDIHKPL